MIWASGKKLYGDRYVIEQKLGAGGFGITYLAKNNKGQPVVIKTLLDHYLTDSNQNRYQEEFYEEAMRLCLCRHPNIVQVENVFKIAQQPCLVMEYIEGQDLEKYVQQSGMLPETEALRYIEQIGEALKVVHDKGLLHRDIKPANIMLRPDKSEAILIDFGLARNFTPNLTHPLTNYLTPGFAPPEQYLERARWGEFTDVYGLAATFYYLVTNTLPLPAPLRTEYTLKQPKEINPNISNRVNDAILQGMMLEQTERPQTIQEWLNLLGIRRVSTMSNFPPNDLSSDVGINYNKLRDLLAEGNWKGADSETRLVMLRAVGREEGDSIEDDKEFLNFPCTDLFTIDSLWLKYSNGKFGFSVQKRIYLSVAGIADGKYYPEAWIKFGERVGWRVSEKVGWREEEQWIFYSNVNFEMSAPPGHLPAWGCGWWKGWAFGLFSRMEACKL